MGPNTFDPGGRVQRLVLYTVHRPNDRSLYTVRHMVTRPALGYIELSSARRPTMRLKVVNAICGERGADMAEPDGAKWGHKGPDPKAWSESCAYYEAVLV